LNADLQAVNRLHRVPRGSRGRFDAWHQPERSHRSHPVRPSDAESGLPRRRCVDRGRL